MKSSNYNKGRVEATSVRGQLYVNGNRYIPPSDLATNGGVTIASVVLMVTVLCLLILGISSALAQAPELYNAETGEYLGNLSANKTDPNSINNPTGIYGSPTSPYSVNNPVGRYGSPSSSDSAHNPTAYNPPIIVAPRRASGLPRMPGLPRLPRLGE